MHLSHKDAEMIGTSGIYFFTVLNALGQASQIRKICRLRSGVSIPVGSTLCVIALFVSAFIYGTSRHLSPVIFNAVVLGIGSGIVAARLWLFKGFRRWEYWLGATLMALLASMILTGHYERWYFAFNIITASSLALQPWEIWRNRSAGAVDIRALLVFEASNVFWVIYAYAIRDRVLMIVCPIYVAVMLTSIILWCIYRQQEQSQACTPS